jgi:protein SCO1/2
MQKLLLPLIVLAAIAGVIVGNHYFGESPNSNKSGVYIDPPGGDFTLDSNQGKVSLSDYDGKVRMLYFGYTFCPDVCPGSLQRIGAAFKKLTPEELTKVQGMLISVDPDRDTLQKLEDYTKYFHPQIVGVTGTKEEIDEIARRYDVEYRKAEGSTPESYLVDHTGYIFVLDKKGKIRDYLPHAVKIDRAVEVIRILLKE